MTQLYRIVDSLLDTEIVLNYAWKDLDVIPRRTLPPKALVIALTPLLDERAAGALIDLRARGFDLAIVEISPVRSSSRADRSSSCSRTTSGSCGATRCAANTSGRVCRLPCGTTTCRWWLRWRR